MKSIAVLGSTGSIGQNTLKVIDHLKSEFKVVALAAKENIDVLTQQIRQFSPELVAVYSEDKALELQKRFPSLTVLAGMEGLKAVASLSTSDMVVSAMSGTIGLQPTIEAIKAGKDIALANKEALVSGGGLVMKLVKKHQVKLIPVDSEHSAIFQCLNGESSRSIRRMIITSSGGPFRNKSSEELDHVSPQEALNHPTYKMGPKITIDSSTLMNKGLEVIEAYWLFNVDIDKIEVIVNPQSIIHSLVEFEDFSMLAQMGEPNMIVPIQYALTHPNRQPGLLKPFDFVKNSKLEFFVPDVTRFRCLALAYEAIKQGGSLPCYMNAANEVLVGRFLAGGISWKEIAGQLEILMSQHHVVPVDSLETILQIDSLAREEALNGILR